MRPAVVYHWWPEDEDSPPIRNLRTPILLSIATLRASDPDIPIYVLDGGTHDYETYPERMGFTVVSWTLGLERYAHCPGWRHLSRLFDLRRFASTIEEDTIIYCDTDVFWKKSPLPLLADPEKFCYNRYNTGYFYFKKDAPVMDRFFEIFESYTITAINDDNFRFVSRQYAGYNEWYHVFDEAILGYMYHKHRELFNVIGLEEHCTPSAMFPDNKPALLDPETVRMIHANGIQVSNEVAKNPGEAGYSRGLIALVVKEFYEKIREIINPLDAFTPEEMARYLPLQVSLEEKVFIEALIENRLSSNLYDLMAALRACEAARRSCLSPGG
jgi:hypothetical protein